MNKILNNKKGVAYTFIYGLVFIFALGILYTIFLYVFEGNLIPVIKQTTENTIHDEAAKLVINEGIDKYMVYFKLMPYILFFCVIVYMIANAIYRQTGSQY